MTAAMPQPKLSHAKAGRDIERRAYGRAADLAEAYAELWEAEATKPLDADDKCSPAIKAGHWRLIEREIRALAKEPMT
jgi:hypothetical protein